MARGLELKIDVRVEASESRNKRLKDKGVGTTTADPVCFLLPIPRRLGRHKSYPA
jgi:hypothetical protein